MQAQVHPYACSGNEMGIHVGTKCQFECVVGYKLTGGSTQATCQQNGLWSGATPLCTGWWFQIFATFAYLLQICKLMKS